MIIYTAGMTNGDRHTLTFPNRDQGIASAILFHLCIQKGPSNIHSVTTGSAKRAMKATQFANLYLPLIYVAW